MKKRYLVFLTALLLFLSACSLDGGQKASNDASDDSDKSTKTEDVTIGFSVSTLNNPFFVSLRDGVLAEAKELGMTVEVVDAQDDSAKQSNDVEDLIQKGVDVLVINPTDSAAISSAVQSANSQGIPVITLDRSADEGDVVSFIASDNVAGGKMAAQYIVDKLGEGANVIELEGIPGASATRERGEGFHNIADDQLKVVAKQSANFDRSEGLSVMENILQANQDITAVFAHNDEMALGAFEAIASSGKDIMVIGFDGTDDALKAVDEGKMEATVAQQPELMGKLAIDTARDVVDGKEVEDHVAVPLKLVTKE